MSSDLSPIQPYDHVPHNDQIAGPVTGSGRAKLRLSRGFPGCHARNVTPQTAINRTFEPTALSHANPRRTGVIVTSFGDRSSFGPLAVLSEARSNGQTSSVGDRSKVEAQPLRACRHSLGTGHCIGHPRHQEPAEQTAETCKRHLREKYRDLGELMDEFIPGIRGSQQGFQLHRWGRSTRFDRRESHQQGNASGSGCSFPSVA
jgi:hypothetical protein